jgi:phosphoglycerate dehydrogenase-like enzyme
MKVVVHTPFATDDLTAALRRVPGVAPVVAKTKDDLRAAMPDAEALVVAASVYDDNVAHAVASAAKLRWIHFITSGVDPLLRFPPPAGVPITNSASGWAPTVAEHAVAMLLALQRRFLPMQAAKSRREWAQLQVRPTLVSLEATTVVLLGFGTIGQRIAALLKPFGARVVAVAQTARTHPDVERIVPVAQLDTLLADAGALVAALPANPATTRLIDARRLAMLPKHAVVVNVGRGETFDEHALAEALRAGRLAGAGLDVFEREPLPEDSPLWSLDNTIVSPHVAGMGRSRLFERLASQCAENARRLVGGQPLEGLVEVACAP